MAITTVKLKKDRLDCIARIFLDISHKEHFSGATLRIEENEWYITPISEEIEIVIDRKED